MKKAPFLGLVLAATIGSTLAYAQGGPGFGPGPDGEGFMQERFAELDANGDGRITRAEAEAKAASDFAAADADGNGTLSEDEARAFHDARREEMHQRMREQHETRGERHFNRAAGDDGVIDQAEFATHGLHRFEMADLDENGEVTETEMQLVARAMHGRHQGGRGDRDGRHHHRGDGPDGDDD